MNFRKMMTHIIKDILHSEAGQHISEFMILILAVSVAFIGMRVYLKRGVYAKLKHMEMQLNEAVQQAPATSSATEGCQATCDAKARAICIDRCIMLGEQTCDYACADDCMRFYDCYINPTGSSCYLCTGRALGYNCLTRDSCYIFYEQSCQASNGASPVGCYDTEYVKCMDLCLE